LPLPSASGFICPQGHYRYSHRALRPGRDFHPINSCPCRAYPQGGGDADKPRASPYPLGFWITARRSPVPHIHSLGA
jgi:hypothetical protein